jgi:hypothetical protein
MPVPTFKVEANWNADADFSDTGEDITLRVLKDAEVAAERGRNQIISRSPPLASDWRAVVNNVSGDYTATKVTSPLYPNVVSGREIRWSATHSAVTYQIIRGYIKRIENHPEWGQQTVSLTAFSQLGRLVGAKGRSTQLYGDGTIANAIRSDQAMGYLFDAFGLTDTGLRAFDLGVSKFLWFWVRPEDEGFDLAIRILNSEGSGAALYDSPTNLSTFKSRHARALDTRSKVVQKTYRDTDNGTDPWYVSPFKDDDGERHVVRACTAPYVSRVVDAANGEIWRYGSSLTLGPNEVRQIQVRPTSDDPIVSVVAPALTTDYTLSSGGISSIVFDRTSGALLTMTVTATPDGAVILGPSQATTGMRVQGKLARAAYTSDVANTVAGPGGVTGQQVRLDGIPEMEYAAIQSLCNALVSLNGVPRPTVVMTVPLVTDVNIAAALSAEIGDRVRVINSRRSFDKEMFVESIRVVAPPGRAPYVLLGCEQTTGTFFILGTSAIDGTDGLSF